MQAGLSWVCNTKIIPEILQHYSRPTMLYMFIRLNHIDFEFYANAIIGANNRGSWIKVDKFALNADTDTVNARLEPRLGAINDWPQYCADCDEKVDIESHKKRWQPTNPEEKGLKQVLRKYLELSESAGSPRAVVYLDDFTESANQQADKKEFGSNENPNPDERTAISLLVFSFVPTDILACIAFDK